MSDSDIYQEGNIVEWQRKLPFSKKYITIFRAYIHGDINKDLFNKLDILTHEYDRTVVVGNKKPFTPDIALLDEENLVDYHPVKKVDGDVFILVHGINSSEITGEDTTATFYTEHRRKFVHTYIKKHFPDATILHFLYPSSMRTLQENGNAFINTIKSLSGIENSRLYLIGYSLGGLVIRYAINHNRFIRYLNPPVLTINTPHRGTPLVSLSFAPSEFWEYAGNISGNTKETATLIKDLKQALILTYMTGAIMAPGYLALRWDHGEHFDRFSTMVSETLYRLNTNDGYINYMFSSSVIPRHHKVEALKVLIEKYRYNPMATRIGLFLCHRLITDIGKLLKVNRWPESDGATPLSSQLPVKYLEEPMHFTPLGPFEGDHIGIILSDSMWDKTLSTLEEIGGR